LQEPKVPIENAPVIRTGNAETLWRRRHATVIFLNDAKTPGKHGDLDEIALMQ
jgi:hypothetical protein